MATIRHLGTREDEAAIGEVLLQVAKGAALRDAELVSAAYADDADWTGEGPYGETVRCHGRPQILATLRERFAHHSARDSAREEERSPQSRPEVRITFLGPDAAWVRSVHGAHRLQVLTRTGGHWRITAELAAVLPEAP